MIFLTFYWVLILWKIQIWNLQPNIIDAAPSVHCTPSDLLNLVTSEVPKSEWTLNDHQGIINDPLYKTFAQNLSDDVHFTDY